MVLVANQYTISLLNRWQEVMEDLDQRSRSFFLQTMLLKGTTATKLRKTDWNTSLHRFWGLNICLTTIKQEFFATVIPPRNDLAAVQADPSRSALWIPKHDLIDSIPVFYIFSGNLGIPDCCRMPHFSLKTTNLLTPFP